MYDIDYVNIDFIETNQTHFDWHNFIILTSYIRNNCHQCNLHWNNIEVIKIIIYTLFQINHNLIKVKIEEEVSNYNEFSLIVEIGSCLGLWLGLCISGIYDMFIQLGHYIMDLVSSGFEKVKGKTKQVSSEIYFLK